MRRENDVTLRTNMKNMVHGVTEVTDFQYLADDLHDIDARSLVDTKRVVSNM